VTGSRGIHVPVRLHGRSCQSCTTLHAAEASPSPREAEAEGASHFVVRRDAPLLQVSCGLRQGTLCAARDRSTGAVPVLAEPGWTAGAPAFQQTSAVDPFEDGGLLSIILDQGTTTAACRVLIVRLRVEVVLVQLMTMPQPPPTNTQKKTNPGSWDRIRIGHVVGRIRTKR
jgi:hypothetical protein